MKFWQKLKKTEGCFVKEKWLQTEMEKRNNMFRLVLRRGTWSISAILNLHTIARFNIIFKKSCCFTKCFVLVEL